MLGNAAFQIANSSLTERSIFLLAAASQSFFLFVSLTQDADRQRTKAASFDYPIAKPLGAAALAAALSEAPPH